MTAIAERIDQIKTLLEMRLVTFDYEAILEAHYRKLIRPGDTVIDVGAHVGRHLRHMVDRVGATGVAIAFEPLPFAYQALCAEFPTSNVLIHNVALSDDEGRSEFTHAQGTPEESGLKPREFNNPTAANPTKIAVDVRTLDGFTETLRNLSFIKIDTEGGEIGCLRGATATLNRFRPIVSVEYGRPSYSAYGHTCETLFDFAVDQGYVLFDLFLNELSNRDDWRVACDSIYWDYFMVPSERREGFVSRLMRS